MAITRKQAATYKQSLTEIEAIMNRIQAENPVAGATRDRAHSDEEFAIKLRLQAQVKREVDLAVAARVIQIPRHTWLEEAIVRQLDRERRGWRKRQGYK